MLHQLAVFLLVASVFGKKPKKDTPCVDSTGTVLVKAKPKKGSSLGAKIWWKFGEDLDAACFELCQGLNAEFDASFGYFLVEEATGECSCAEKLKFSEKGTLYRVGATRTKVSFKLEKTASRNDQEYLKCVGDAEKVLPIITPYKLKAQDTAVINEVTDLMRSYLDDVDGSRTVASHCDGTQCVIGVYPDVPFVHIASLADVASLPLSGEDSLTGPNLISTRGAQDLELPDPFVGWGEFSDLPGDDIIDIGRRCDESVADIPEGYTRFVLQLRSPVTWWKAMSWEDTYILQASDQRGLHDQVDIRTSSLINNELWFWKAAMFGVGRQIYQIVNPEVFDSGCRYWINWTKD